MPRRPSLTAKTQEDLQRLINHGQAIADEKSVADDEHDREEADALYRACRFIRQLSRWKDRDRQTD